MTVVMVVEYCRKGSYGGNLAGFASLKTLYPSITMRVGISLGGLEYGNHIVGMGFLVLVELKEEVVEMRRL